MAHILFFRIFFAKEFFYNISPCNIKLSCIYIELCTRIQSKADITTYKKKKIEGFVVDKTLVKIGSESIWI